MIRYDFAGRAILLDIEGTTSALAFVRDVLFPYVRTHLESFLRARWADPALARARDLVARDAGAPSFAAWCGEVSGDAAQARLRAEILRLMDDDVKATGLKALQGLVWEAGYRAGLLRAHVFPDVPPALASWQAAGLDLRVYSSGSTAAQCLFFRHTIAGDLSGRFRGHYDTTIGPKREPSSYAAISADIGVRPDEILFLSDVPSELDAAHAAGLAAVLVERPGNAPVAAELPYPRITFFGQVAPIGPTLRPMGIGRMNAVTTRS
jgi:enolase-phosphatase E1